MGIFDFWHKEKPIENAIVIPDDLKNIEKLLEEVKCKGKLPIRLPEVVIKSLKEIANTENWYNQLDEESINTLNIIYDKWQNSIISRQKSKIQKAQKVGETGGFEKPIEYEEEDDEDFNDSNVIVYSHDYETGEFELYENYKPNENNIEVNDIIECDEKILNYLIDAAYISYFGWDKLEFKYKYLRMIKRIKDKIDFNPKLNNNLDEDHQIIKPQNEKTLKYLNISSLNIKPEDIKDFKKYQITEKEWRAFSIVLYCEEIYANEWDICNSFPPQGFTEGIIYEKYKNLFDAKTNFIKSCNLEDFIKEQIDYFGFLKNGIFDDGVANYIESLIPKIKLICSIPKDIIIKICTAYITNYATYEWGFPETIVSNGKEIFFAYTKKKKNLSDCERNWILYFQENCIPVKIIRIKEG